MKMKSAISVILISLVLAACGPGNRAGTGTVVGAVAGGIIGNQAGDGQGRAIATAVGAVVGGIIGHEIGRSLDEADRRAATAAEYRALEYGKSGAAMPWRNPDSGHHGSVVAHKPYVAGNRHCRTYAHTIYIDGRPETMKGKACRRPDGTWRNVS